MVTHFDHTVYAVNVCGAIVYVTGSEKTCLMDAYFGGQFNKYLTAITVDKSGSQG